MEHLGKSQKTTLTATLSDLSQELMKELHDQGFRPPIFDKTISRIASATKLFTFEKRLNEICDVLEVSLHCLDSQSTLLTSDRPQRVFLPRS